MLLVDRADKGEQLDVDPVGLLLGDRAEEGAPLDVKPSGRG